MALTCMRALFPLPLITERRHQYIAAGQYGVEKGLPVEKTGRAWLKLRDARLAISSWPRLNFEMNSLAPRILLCFKVHPEPKMFCVLQL